MSQAESPQFLEEGAANLPLGKPTCPRCHEEFAALNPTVAYTELQERFAIDREFQLTASGTFTCDWTTIETEEITTAEGEGGLQICSREIITETTDRINDGGVEFTFSMTAALTGHKCNALACGFGVKGNITPVALVLDGEETVVGAGTMTRIHKQDITTICGNNGCTPGQLVGYDDEVELDLEVRITDSASLTEQICRTGDTYSYSARAHVRVQLWSIHPVTADETIEDEIFIALYAGSYDEAKLPPGFSGEPYLVDPDSGVEMFALTPEALAGTLATAVNYRALVTDHDMTHTYAGGYGTPGNCPTPSYLLKERTGERKGELASVALVDL